MGAYIVDFVLVILVCLSVLSWVIAIYKIRQEQKKIEEAKKFSDIFWSSESWDAARQVVVSDDSDLSELARSGYAVYDEYLTNPHSLKHAGEVNEVLERPLRHKAEELLRAREKGLSELASIGSLSPFIGLFGTVWGIMGALQGIGESGQASIDIVAGPIGEALIATAIGIATALPAVFFFNYFNRRLRLITTNFEGFINDFLRLAVREIKQK
jgi:biopolymer transport protein ExbB